METRDIIGPLVTGRRRAWRAAALLAVAGGAAPLPAAQSCDRACLEQVVDRYLDAMVAHDPSRLATTANVRFTENGQEQPLGGALWQTASGRGKYRITLADPEKGEVGFLGTVVENGTPAILGLRLAVTADGKVREAEQVVGRSKDGAEALDRMGAPDPLFHETVPPARRLSRAELAHIANLYFDAFGESKGRNTPFSDDCERIENGTRTTNNAELAAKSNRAFTYIHLGCAAQFATGYLKIVTEVRERRYPVVDVERQLVLSFGFLDHAGNIKEVKVSDGRTVPVSLNAPFTWEFAELFRIDDRKLRRIEAVLNAVPYRMRSGWPPEPLP